MMWAPSLVYIKYLVLTGMAASASWKVFGISAFSFSTSSGALEGAGVAVGASVMSGVLVGIVLLVVGLVLLGEIALGLAMFRPLACFGVAMDAAARFTAKTTSNSTVKTAAETFIFLCICFTSKRYVRRFILGNPWKHVK